jgi:hypothetical protein
VCNGLVIAYHFQLEVLLLFLQCNVLVLFPFRLILFLVAACLKATVLHRYLENPDEFVQNERVHLSHVDRSR